MSGVSDSSGSPPHTRSTPRRRDAAPASRRRSSGSTTITLNKKGISESPSPPNEYDDAASPVAAPLLGPGSQSPPSSTITSSTSPSSSSSSRARNKEFERALIKDLVSSVSHEMKVLRAQQERVESIMGQLLDCSDSGSQETVASSKSPDKLTRRKNKLKEEVAQLKSEKEKLSAKVVDIGEIVSLNVGGIIHYTSRVTLVKAEGTMLSAMFSGRHHITKDSNGHYFIDRDGVCFGHILNYLRTFTLPDLSPAQLLQLRFEADFFSILPLLHYIDDRLRELQHGQYAVLRYNENSNHNNLSWQGITQPCPLTLGSGSLYKSIDQVLSDVDEAGWRFVSMAGDGSAEGGWMYVFRYCPPPRPAEFDPFAIYLSGQQDSSSSTASLGKSNKISAAAPEDLIQNTGGSTGVLLTRPPTLTRKHSGSF